LFGANQSGLIDLVCSMNRFVRSNTYVLKRKGRAMRKHRIFQNFILIGLTIGGTALITNGTRAVAQENRGTLEQQMACTPDVWRLCGSAIPDANRIVACLRSNTPQLSAPCRAVFESSDSTANPPPQNAPQPLTPPVRRGYQYQ
jgi:hypothetical protein